VNYFHGCSRNIMSGAVAKAGEPFGDVSFVACCAAARGDAPKAQARILVPLRRRRRR
jgi:hypothetical protein